MAGAGGDAVFLPDTFLTGTAFFATFLAGTFLTAAFFTAALSHFPPYSPPCASEVRQRLRPYRLHSACVSALRV